MKISNGKSEFGRKIKMSKGKMPKKIRKNVENKKAKDLNERWRLGCGAEGDHRNEGEGTIRVRMTVTARQN